MAQASSSYQLFGIDFGSNPGQRELIRQINEDCNRKPVVFCKGSAGTGKTFAALAAALALVRGKGAKRKYKTVYYVREPVEIGHRLGYLKGTEEDKLAPYLGPLLDNYNHLMAKARAEMSVSEVRASKRKKSFDEDEDMMPLTMVKLDWVLVLGPISTSKASSGICPTRNPDTSWVLTV